MQDVQKCSCTCCVHMDDKCSCDCQQCVDHKGQAPTLEQVKEEVAQE